MQTIHATGVETSTKAAPKLGPARLLMCPPDYYGIEYEINPWMSRSRGSDSGKARRQWEDLYRLLQSLGALIDLLEPTTGLPDMVFTANAGMIYRDRVFLSRFRYNVREGEVAHYERWFADRGFHVDTLPSGLFFEGAGDALFCGSTLFAGYRIRSDARSHQWVASRIGCRVIPVELVDPRFYHLDTCFCPLEPGVAMYYPDAFDDYGRRALAAHIPSLIPIQPDEALRFAANAVVIGKTVVLNTGCPQLERALIAHGYECRSTDLGEYLKAGGSAKCLTLRLDGEEAAVW
ncbi:MAG: amidinotransferase [Planctomycetes bacterium]|nr:amidinotransferase [Planctomycetota bacterium]